MVKAVKKNSKSTITVVGFTIILVAIVFGLVIPIATDAKSYGNNDGLCLGFNYPEPNYSAKPGTKFHILTGGLNDYLEAIETVRNYQNQFGGVSIYCMTDPPAYKLYL